MAEKVDKIELSKISNQLIPEGRPDFKNVINYPAIKKIAEENFKLTALMISSLIKDFCSSFNVVRNMNEDQILESAMILIEDAGNYRVEDYVMMFSLAKKGKLRVKIMDRIDLDIINQLSIAYHELRSNEGYKIQQRQNEEEESKIDNVENIVGAEAWSELVKKMKADYKDGKTGFKISEEQKLEAKKKRVEHASKLFWGEK